ncbi:MULTISPECIES: FecCD family ABC transporter permease [Butyrivibrio]|jgi:iron complex transport system permease protein|uniref:FecCD family ABC transporter permease n=1 Tax=Butyrivibrio TaxID=830 RepID=UPI0003B4760C|nr:MULTISPECIES: iron ABC transporter permease [Butyrivibrio]SEP59056.1 iron complex transport system permease protein [Butyrivibrio sp. TB]
MSKEKSFGKNTLEVITILVCLIILGICMGIGSVDIPLKDAMTILGGKIFGTYIPDELAATTSILWTIRLPRAMTAFLVGGALALSGAIMQSVLQNPLASSYTLGVSSGASLGASIIIVTQFTIPALGSFLLPTFGFAFGFATVLLVIAIASRFDNTLHSNTVILIGMVVSLFTNAVMTLVSSFARAHSQQLLLWTMGSFSGKRWYHVQILLPLCIFGMIVTLYHARSMDIMSFGDEQAYAMGVNVRTRKKILLLLASLLTGASVCFSGTIGFVDLIAPHAVRIVFGSSHKRVVPMSFFVGGAFMAFCDMVARTAVESELPVGAVTGVIGAPFFVWLYLRGSKES